MSAGTVIAGRFTLETQAGRGGMGAVYRAHDALSGQLVALKLLHVDSAEALQRFFREATLLATLRHPGIVAYVAHGTADQGLPFLAMEWLDGEDLSRRLARQPLQLEEALALLRRAADALALAHQRGVIHRDLKPSNLFLRHGLPDDIVLLDFGLARNVVSPTALTVSQMVLGTPGFMAPEQASGHSVITPAADIFSLGCVLYECLAGQPPFSAPHFVAALAKILFTEPPPLRSLRPDLPGALQQLLERMLAKDPARRIPDAPRLLAALDELDASATPTHAAPAPVAPPNLAGAEQYLVSVLLAAPRGDASAEPGVRLALRDTLRALLAPQSARVELLANGSLAVTLAASGSAADSAALAARCALSIQERWPDATVVLTTGRGRLDPNIPVGEAMDRAGQLLNRLHDAPATPGPVLLDEVTAGLLRSRFQLSQPEAGLILLHGEELGADTLRPLLGKPTPCVGREQELATLELAFSACVDESTPQALLVVAPPGAGKSRLYHELLRRLERQGRSPLVLLGRGDPISAGSADGLLGQALRRLCDVSTGDSLETRRRKLHARVGQQLPAAQAQSVAELLGELCGIPFPDEHSPKLRAARGDPAQLSAQMGRALVTLLKAECSRQPVLLVLEDLHWGDVPTVKLIDEALRELAEHPFMVLALARPEVEQLLAPTALARRLQRLPLRGLSRKAGARLVREVLGSNLPEPLVDRLVEQSAGNALFLEELIRGQAQGRGESPPATVLAMLQARLTHLEPQARQILMAASVFGRAFWPGGVGALLGTELAPVEREPWWGRLVESEWIEPQPASRFTGEPEYRFRHALVRDAAYGLVPDDHRPVGHQLAGAWLEAAGESDPRVLAEHAACGHQRERAIHFYTRAAEQLIERDDAPGTVRCVEAALALGPEGAAERRLRALEAANAFWMGDVTKLFAAGDGALTELPPGSRLWSSLAGALYLGRAMAGAPTEVNARLGQDLLRVRPVPGGRESLLETLNSAVTINTWRGARQEASSFVKRLLELRAETTPDGPADPAWSCYAPGFFSFHFETRPWQTQLQAEQAYRGFLALEQERKGRLMQVLWALSLEALGDRGGAEAGLRESLAELQRLGEPISAMYVVLHLALFLADSAEPAQRAEALSLVNGFEAERLIQYHAGLIHTVKGKAAAADGALAEAERWARTACEQLASFKVCLRTSLVLLSQVLLAQGRAAEARAAAALGVGYLEESGGEGVEAVSLRLSLAEACFAQGDPAAGEAALRRAWQSVREGARDIPGEAERERFLQRVPRNARVLELWGDRAA